MAYAHNKKIARINLTTGTVTVEQPDTDLAFIGGRGLGAKIAYDEGCATADPMGPDNKLIYITGPLTDAGVPSSGRYAVVTKSPQTGMLACSNSGGSWGAKLKRAGWDALIVEGEAPAWIYINIVDDKIELLDARGYLGMLSTELNEKLKEKHGKDSSALTIGIAGEKKVMLAVIMNDKGRAAGRGGVGAVMGSKKLKGIVVTASKQKTGKICEDLAGVCQQCPKACGKAGDQSDIDMWCNAYGLDAIAVSQTIAAAAELCRRGVIPEEDWGIAAIGRIGDPQTELDWLMSAGPDSLCKHYGLPEVATSVKKMLRGSRPVYAPEIAGRNRKAVIDAMGLCLFTSFALGVPEYTKLLNEACGTSYTPEQVLEIGERIYGIEQMFNQAAEPKL